MLSHLFGETPFVPKHMSNYCFPLVRFLACSVFLWSHLHFGFIYYARYYSFFAIVALLL